MKRISKYNIEMFRAFCLTMALICCFFVALTSMGHIYTVTEYNAYGREAVAFYVGPDSIVLFDREIYLPIFTPVKEGVKAVRLYSSGIIKLLGISIEASEELLLALLKLFEFSFS